MDIQDVLIEMRWCRWWPTAQGWADAIEAAMREKDAVIAKLGNGYAETGRVLDAKDAEIERLKALLTAGGIVDQYAEIKRLTKAAQTFITAMNDCSDYPDTTSDMEGLVYAKRKIEAALNRKEMSHE